MKNEIKHDFLHALLFLPVCVILLYFVRTRYSLFGFYTTVCRKRKLYEIEPGHEKTCLMSYANSKGADQPAHPCSLISAFVLCYLDSVMSLVSVTKISSLMLASVAEQASLSLTLSETPEDTFSHDEAQLVSRKCLDENGC